ncbi:MAG: hypothetical protein FH748_02810 [Balneolaceae bacterium]|nr:hypothetical protein [Balneolaceae bacterium]
MSVRKLISGIVMVVITIGIISACETTTSDVKYTQEIKGDVQFQFKTVMPTSNKTAVSVNHDSLVVEGSNGTLHIEDEEDKGENTTLADSIRTVFPHWPDEASMAISGTYTNTDGETFLLLGIRQSRNRD